MNLESTYQKHLTDLNELTSIIGSNSEMNDLDLNACDVDTLRHLIKQNKVSVKTELKTFSIYSPCRMIIFPLFLSGHREHPATRSQAQVRGRHI